MRIIFLIFLILISFSLKADMIKPNSSIKALDVILIQLKALQNNDFPFENAGIEQTWEFAHPNNRAFTGPLDNFIRMIKNPSYSMMLNHLNHEIIPIEERKNTSFFFVELTDSNGSKFGFEWIVSKVLEENVFKDCWMTFGVSKPILLDKSI